MLINKIKIIKYKYKEWKIKFWNKWSLKPLTIVDENLSWFFVTVSKSIFSDCDDWIKLNTNKKLLYKKSFKFPEIVKIINTKAKDEKK